MTLADRIVCLQGGSIAQVGTPSELYNRPANLFVAEFIGSPPMNLLPGEIVHEADRIALQLAEGLRIDLPQGVVARYRKLPAKEVVIGFRPEHLRERAGVNTTPLSLNIALLEPLGSDTMVHAHFAGTRIVGRVAPERLSDADTSITLHLDLDHLHLFDPGSGDRVQ
jgi:multiple sugar transport system ATP-binding protein